MPARTRRRHLDLRRAGETGRPRPGWVHVKKADRDPAEFARAQARLLDEMGESYRRDRESAGPLPDPNLIFKVELNGGVHDETFRRSLAGVDIKTVSSAPAKSGYWVGLTDDPGFARLRKKLEERATAEKSSFVDQVRAIREVPPSEKIGASLSSRPLPDSGRGYVDVEIWRMDDERLTRFMGGMQAVVREGGGRVTDQLRTDGYCALRLHCARPLLEKIAQMREVARIDRPPRAAVGAQAGGGVGAEAAPAGSPDPGMPGVLVVDSGVDNHPLLKAAIGGRTAHPSASGGVAANWDIDDAGHGTSVAGRALYGHIEGPPAPDTLLPQVWIYSAKVMYGYHGRAVFDEESLVESQLRDAVEQAVQSHENCRIVNVSFGNLDAVAKGDQLPIAKIVDELSEAHPELLFVISAGNIPDEDLEGLEYPEYLAEPLAGHRLIDPATAVRALSVGSIHRMPSDQGNIDAPSRFTRVGPGLYSTIKPELVEYGGDGDGVLVVNPRWRSEGRLFTYDYGTSYSAPVVSHMLAVLSGAFAGASSALLKALLLSSATVPARRPGSLGDLDGRGGAGDIAALLGVYGYGKPILEHALHSDYDRVLLKHEGTIGVGRVHFFPLVLPPEFVSERGARSIEVTLAFDPPIDIKMQDYIGVSMDYRLYKNASADRIMGVYEDASKGSGSDESVGETLKKNKVKLLPGSRIRDNSTHQKSSVTYRARPSIDPRYPLVLAVSCRKRWLKDGRHAQKYAVIVRVTHDSELDLYDLIKERMPVAPSTERVPV